MIGVELSMLKVHFDEWITGMNEFHIFKLPENITLFWWSSVSDNTNTYSMYNLHVCLKRWKRLNHHDGIKNNKRSIRFDSIKRMVFGQIVCPICRKNYNVLKAIDPSEIQLNFNLKPVTK